MTDERRQPDQEQASEHQEQAPEYQEQAPEPEHQEPFASSRNEDPEQDPSYEPYAERKRRWSVPRLILIAALTVLAFIIFIVIVRGKGEPDGPTLESQVQTQQQVIDQLRVSVEELRAEADERDGQAQGVSNRLGEMSSRLDDLEENRLDPSLQNLPNQVDELSSRLDEISGSVDMRFSAAQEKEQSLETSIEELHKQRASQKTSSQQRQSSPPRQTRAEPKPPFTISGIELRGGRSYLAISSGNTGRLSDLRLVGEGQTIGQWHLSSIDGHSAAFTVNGQSVVVPVP